MADPLRSGLEGVTVTVRGENGTFEAVTGGVIGLWKLDIPSGTYTVTPRKAGYTMEHISLGGSDGQHSITVEVNRENLAPNQSIQFLAIELPQVSTPPVASAHETGRTGGGCAAARERRGRACDFFAPYVACLFILFVTTCTDARKSHRRHK